MEVACCLENLALSSYQYYAGKKKKPDWLIVDLILGCVGNELSSSQNKYIDFVLARMNGNYDSPMDETFASMILGDDNFIEKITKKYLTDKNKDRNLPALREIKKSVSIDSIYKKVKFLPGDNDSITRNSVLSRI